MRGGRIKARWRRLLLSALAIPLLAWGGFELLVHLLPYPEELTARPATAQVLLDREGRLLFAACAPDGAWRLPAGPLDDRLAAAVIAAEDRRFHDHAGIDHLAILHAAWRNLVNRRTVRGASTITMQVQRLRDPRPRTLWTKVVESLRARQLEIRHGKRELLAEWCARAPFPGNAVGAEAGAWRWFGRPVAACSLAQVALLAGLPQHPARLRPDRFPAAALARRDRILAAMAGMGAISPAEAAAAQAEPLGLAPQEPPDARRLALLPVATTWPGTGVRQTSIDAGFQLAAARALDRALAELDGSGVDCGALLALDIATREWRALAVRGPEPWQDLSCARRSPGSALKPFLFAAAFAAGACTPGTLLDDGPAGWIGYAPANSDRVHRGRLAAATALAESRNLPAMQVLERLGLDQAAAVLAGGSLALDPAAVRRAGLALAVGGIEVTPRQLAQGYADLVRGSLGLERGLLPRSACLAVLEALAGRERCAAVAPAAARLGAAWKTGTSNGNRDAWCAAASRSLVVVAWLGTVRGGGSRLLTGVEVAAPLALGLLAALDPDGGGWGDPPPPSPEEPPPRLLPAALVISSPGNGSELLLDPGLPGQRLRLDARGGSGPGRWWYVDGSPLVQVAAGQEAWWDPVPGRHRLSVVDGEGRCAVVELRVR